MPEDTPIKSASPIVVDLDGTLLDSDFLIECAFQYIKSNPLRIFTLIIWLFKGKSHLKTCLAEHVTIDVATLPYNTTLLHWLKEQKTAGREIVLATATHQAFANRIAEHLGIFDLTLGTTEHRNLASSNKQQELTQRFGANSYEYVGNAKADIPVWKTAKTAHIVNPEFGVESKARKLGKTGEIFHTRPNHIKTLARTLRLHQWMKNLLIFVPLAASHMLLSPQHILWALIAFVVFGMTASSVYLLNDLLDLQDDRHHHSKKKRPLASGSFPIKHAVALIPILLLISFGITILGSSVLRIH